MIPIPIPIPIPVGPTPVCVSDAHTVCAADVLRNVGHLPSSPVASVLLVLLGCYMGYTMMRLIAGIAGIAGPPLTRDQVQAVVRFVGRLRRQRPYTGQTERLDR